MARADMSQAVSLTLAADRQDDGVSRQFLRVCCPVGAEGRRTFVNFDAVGFSAGLPLPAPAGGRHFRGQSSLASSATTGTTVPENNAWCGAALSVAHSWTLKAGTADGFAFDELHLGSKLGGADAHVPRRPPPTSNHNLFHGNPPLILTHSLSETRATQQHRLFDKFWRSLAMNWPASAPSTHSVIIAQTQVHHRPDDDITVPTTIGRCNCREPTFGELMIGVKWSTWTRRGR